LKLEFILIHNNVVMTTYSCNPSKLSTCWYVCLFEQFWNIHVLNVLPCLKICLECA
jgi:hypothetical protein